MQEGRRQEVTMLPHAGFGFGLYGLGYLFVILCIALIVVGIALLLRRSAPAAPPAPTIDPRTQAQRILEERFARGDIDEAEYRSRLEVLLGTQAWLPGAPLDVPGPGGEGGGQAQ